MHFPGTLRGEGTSQLRMDPTSTAPTGALDRRGVSEGLGLLAGLLICASLPPWGWWPLAFLGVALWVFILGPTSKGPRGPGRRFMISWAVGLGWFVPSTLWMWGLTQPGYVVGTLFGWGPMVAVIGLGSPSSRLRYLGIPAGIVIFEWFHLSAPFGGVPLSMLSMSQGRGPLLVIARLGGGLLVSGTIAAIGVALFIVVSERRWKEPVAILAVTAVLIGAGHAAAALIRPVDGSRKIRIAAVQGGGPQGTIFSYEEIPEVFARHLEATRTIHEPVDLVVWPENAINVQGPFKDDPWKQALAEEAARLDAPIMVGVVEDDPTDSGKFLNYVVVVNPDGSLGDRYDKERRVPFGEYVPLRPFFELFAKSTLPQRDARPGVGEATVDTPAGPMAVAISWEIFFPRRVREGVRGGGEVVLNPTNGSSYWLTQVQTQQLSTSAFRAVESGRWLVQVAPTGFSAVFNDNGKILQRSNISEQRVLYADVPMMTGTTPAQKFGELPPVALALVAAAVIAVKSRRRNGRTDKSDHSADGGGHLTVKAPHSEA
ncbi:MAG TPA: apolipoprotein N-acyltransferase [Microthrixaceae bacterium]|nr:apolipoprotein N-acyltransferase [Microthrixaceae bacterium]